MDPLTALSLGANILQVIDFGSRLVKLTRDVIESGDVYDYYHLHQTSSDLLKVVGNLSQTGNVNGDTQNVSIEKPPQALRDLAQACKVEAHAMITKLQNSRILKDVEGKKVSHKSALKAAGMAIWNKSEVDDMASRLNSYRTQLSLRILDIINTRSIKQDTVIVEVLSLTQSIDSSCQAVAAMLKKVDGTVETILSERQLPGSNRLTDTLSITYQDRGIASKAQDSNETTRYHAVETEISFDKVAQKIMNSLWFPLFNSRQEMVEDPFEKTFSWISARQDVEIAQWDDFPMWLRMGTGCYWINGKAGSGKSTLMKYVAKHPTLAENLRTWAGDDELLQASFFFWRAGMSSLQKSQEGLLRSLLLQVLDRRRDLITVCFPTLCRRLIHTDHYFQELEVSFDELRTAILLLAEHGLSKTKVFLLIDGLDEYQGDYRDLISLISRVAASPIMKILVSSRPIPLIFQAFKKCPRLDIHDLTLSDIRRYAEEHLRHDDTLATMDELDPGVSSQLIDSIVSKASGVFLWVKIVIRDLLYSLAHHDSFETLFRNLDRLPADLLELYDYMFKTMTSSYREEASRAIRLLKRSEEVQFDYPMTALQLAFARMKEVTSAQPIPSKFLSKDEEDAHCKLVEGWLRSRCCGLLEVQRSYWGPHDHRRYVGFLHRTVLDYFGREDIQAQFLAWDSMPIDIDDILFSSCVMEVRQYTQNIQATCSTDLQSSESLTVSQLQQTTPSTATRIIHAIAFCAAQPACNQEKYAMAMEQMTQAFQSLSHTEKSEVGLRALLKARHSSLSVLHYTSSDTSQGLRMFAALHGLLHSSFLASHNKQSCSMALFNNLVYLSHHPTRVNTSKVVAGVRQLLALGTDPNEPCLFFESAERINATEEVKAALRLSPNQDHSLIPWIFWLSCKQTGSSITAQDYLLYIEVLGYMITAGATLKGDLGPPNPPRLSKLSFVEHCIEEIPDTSQEALDVRSRIQDIVNKALASCQQTEGVKASRSVSKSFKFPLRLTRKKNASKPL